MKNKENIKTVGFFISIFGVLLGVVAFFLVSIYFGTWQMDEVPRSINSSLLGAVITVCITALLLNQQTAQQQKLLQKQTEAEQDKDRSAVLFNKRAEAFDKYIDELYKSVQDGEVDVGELKSLRDGLNFRLRMYLDDKSFNEVGDMLMEMNKVRKGETDKNPMELGVGIVAILNRNLNHPKTEGEEA